MSCRQYTCPNCWNEAEARCLSCAPHLGHEIMPAPFPDMPATTFPPAATVTPAFLRAATTSNGSNGSAHPAELIGASELIGAAEIDAGNQDDEFDAAARLATLTGPAAEPSIDSDIPYLTAAIVAPAPEPEAITAPELVAEAEAVEAETEPASEPEALADAVVSEPEPEALTASEPEAVVAEQGPEPVAATEAVTAEAIAEPDGATAPEPSRGGSDRPGGRRAATRSSQTSRPRPSMRPAPRSHRWPRPPSSSRSSPTSPNRR